MIQEKKRFFSWFFITDLHTTPQMNKSSFRIFFSWKESNMQPAEIDQVKNILSNLENSKRKIPYLSDLQLHPIFWNIFSNLSKDEEKEINNIIKEYILEKLEAIKKTKWGQLFARFAESNPELFWKFREINDSSIEDKEFQTIWKQVENEMFKLEWILTEKMLKQEKWLDKVIDSFYNIVYLFFPRFNEIE